MPPQTGAPEGEAIAGFVEVFADAELFTAPKADAPHFRLARFPEDEPRRAHPRGLMYLPVKKDHGAFIEVGLSPVPDGMNADKGCGDLTLELEGVDADEHGLIVDVGLFVRRADLAAVITTPFAKRWDDGTSVELEPGAVVAPVPGGFVAELDGLTRRIDGDAPIGHAFPAAPERLEDDRRDRVALHRFDALTLGGAALPDPGWPFIRTAPSARAARDRALFPLIQRCHRVVVSAPTTALRPYKPEESLPNLWGGPGLAGLAPLNAGQFVWVMPKETKLECSLAAVRAKLERDRYMGSDRKDLCVPLALSVTNHTWLSKPPESHDVKITCCAKAARAVKRKLDPGVGLGGPKHRRPKRR